MRTREVEAAMKVVADEFAEAVADAFAGDGAAFLQIVSAIGNGVRPPYTHRRQAPWRQLRVVHGVGDRGMAKEVLVVWPTGVIDTVEINNAGFDKSANLSLAYCGPGCLMRLGRKPVEANCEYPFPSATSGTAKSDLVSTPTSVCKR